MLVNTLEMMGNRMERKAYLKRFDTQHQIANWKVSVNTFEIVTFQVIPRRRAVENLLKAIGHKHNERQNAHDLYLRKTNS